MRSRKTQNPPHIAKRTGLLILWEITNYSSEYVFIANYISELCLQVLASQCITGSTFLLFLQYLQEPTGTYETRHLRFPQFKMVQEAKV